MRRKLIDLHSHDVDPSYANAGKPVSEENHSFEGGSGERLIFDWDLGTAGVQNLED